MHGIHGFSVETLEMFFENKKKSGGGDVEKVEINHETDTALITFEDPNGMKFVISHSFCNEQNNWVSKIV